MQPQGDNIDLSKYQSIQDQDEMSPGTYPAQIVKSTKVQWRKDENKYYLEVEFEIIEGAYFGKKLRSWFWIYGEDNNDKFKAICYLKGLCDVIDISVFTSPQILQDKLCKIKVRKFLDENTGKPNYKIRGYERFQGTINNSPPQSSPQEHSSPPFSQPTQQESMPSGQSPSGQQQPPQEPYNPNDKPWERN